DHDEDDLPAAADRGVRGVADEVPDHRVIDDALQPGDHVLEHRRPRDLPDGGCDRSFDEAEIGRARARAIGPSTSERSNVRVRGRVTATESPAYPTLARGLTGRTARRLTRSTGGLSH